MLTRLGPTELGWRFEGGALVRFPVGAWVRRGPDPAPVSDLSVEEDRATVTYQGGLVLRLGHALDPRTGALVQALELRVREGTPGLLLDVRLVPDIPEPLDWLTVPGLFYGDNDLTSDRVEYPRGMRRDWSSRADGSPCPGVHLAGAGRGHAAFLPNDRVELLGGPPLEEGRSDIVGVGWVHGPDRSRAIRFTFPCQEEPHAYSTPDRLAPPRRPRLDAPAGTVVRLRIHHFVTPGGRAGYQRAARAMAAQGRPARLDRGRDRIPETARLFAGCRRDAHFGPGIGFSHRVDLREHHSGWSGGFAAAEAGLLHGAAAPDPVLLGQAEQMADFVCGTGLSRLGYFMAEHRRGWVLRGRRRWYPHV